jgi:glyoxylase-like metal-dependent hydrolase (beta-lactamase superfamily II)
MDDRDERGGTAQRPRTPPAVPGITPIDTRMAGRRLVTSAYLVEAAEPALIETGPTTSVDAVTSGLAELGVGPPELAHVIVTHIHLDHAGGVGALAERFPHATIWVHDRGAPHLADPARLVVSVARVYGEERMRALFGPVLPTDGSRIRAIGDGDAIELGDRRIEVVYTPGHASHHVALADAASGAVFTGDALGIHLPDVGVLRPATPPPDIDVEAGTASIARIRALAPPVLLFSHYGPVAEADELCDLAQRRLIRWAEVVRAALPTGTADLDDDLDRVAEILDHSTADEFDDAPPGVDREAARDRYELLATMRMNAAGLARYWRRREEREAGAVAGSSGGANRRPRA